MSGSIGGVDASIPLQTKPPPQFNALGTIGEFANAQNALNQNRLFPGQLAQQGQQVQGGALSLAQHINQAAAAVMAPLMAKAPGTITHDDLTTYAGMGENMHVPMGTMTAAMASLPKGDGPEFDTAFRNWQLANSQSPENAVAAVTPTTVLQSTGRQIVPVNIAPRGSATGGAITQPTGAVPLALSPSEAANRTIIGYDPKTNAAIYGPLTAVTPPAISGWPATPAPLGSGRYPPDALRNPASAPPSTGTVIAPSPAQLAASNAQGASSSQNFDTVTQRGNQAVQQNAMLSNMQNDLARFTVGTGTKTTLDYERALQSWAPGLARWFNFDPKAIAANESFDKLAAQIADAQGAGSDHRLDVTQAANPHSGLSPTGAELIIRQLQGNTDYLRAMQAQAEAYPDKTDYRGFSADMAKRLDPRFFQLNRMTPEQQTDYMKSIPADQKTVFKQRYAAAKNDGLLDVGQ